MPFVEERVDVVVVGAGHAGCEAALACARLGLETAIFTVSVDSIALMPCNPNIGGSSKGHLVREIDALGGEMGKNIDKTFIQSKMLNVSKGPAVHSLRAQADKAEYSRQMRMVLENTDHLSIVQAEVTEILAEDGKVTGVTVNDEKIIPTGQIVLAIGHSARDTFAYLEKQHIPMEAKSFAVGMRVEHPQRLINEAMYGKEHGKQLAAAPYKLTAKTSVDRGVYSFCMCPGGYVVNASSEEGRVAVNGMSYSKRDSSNANSAIIVTVTPDDFPGDGPLAGVRFQRSLEEKAYALGKGAIPVQYYEDFLSDTVSIEKKDYQKPCIKGKFTYSNLRGLLPKTCETAFIEGMTHFNHLIPGFAAEDVLLSGIESRTSSPVRIQRDDSLQSPAVKGLYPCGEGAGYAGGITSAAMDGLLIAEKIMERFAPFA